MQFREQFSADPQPVPEGTDAQPLRQCSPGNPEGCSPGVSPWAVFSSIDDTEKAQYGGQGVVRSTPAVEEDL